jgi:hypothetical protein
MKDKEQLVVHFDDQALAKAPQTRHGSALGGRQWWIDRPEKERAGEPHPRNPAADYAGLQRVEVQKNVRKLGHAATKPGLIYTCSDASFC